MVMSFPLDLCDMDSQSIAVVIVDVVLLRI